VFFRLVFISLFDERTGSLIQAVRRFFSRAHTLTGALRGAKATFSCGARTVRVLRLLLASRSEVLSAVMNCHTHLHVIVIDGVFSRQEGGTTRFHFVEPPSAQELASMVATICERVCRMLRRRGLMGEASHDSNEVRLPEAALDGCRTVALSRGRFERLDEQGRAQQRLFADDEQGMRRKKDARWSADWRGFSLHAGVSFGALDRRRHLKLASGDRLAGSTVRS